MPAVGLRSFIIEAETEDEAADKLLSLLLDTPLVPGVRYSITYRIAGQETTCAYTHASHDDWVLADAEERRK